MDRHHCFRLLSLCTFLYSVHGYQVNYVGPCGKDLAGISVFPGDPLYEKSATVWNPAYANVKPAFVALPKTVGDVQQCLLCAYKNIVPFTVKSGGHSKIGQSTINGSNDGAFVIYFSQMKAIEMIGESEIKVQAGATWEDIYDYVKKTNYIIVGGDCPTVGVAGFTLGSGISLITRKYGLGLDNVVSFTMATVDGTKTVTADANTNTDLYWALRGGGGGNFGVVTDFTLKLHPSFPSYTFGYLYFMNNTIKNIPQVLSMIGTEVFDTELRFGLTLKGENTLNVTFLNLGPLSSSTEGKLNELKNYASEFVSHEYRTYWEARGALNIPGSNDSYMEKECLLKTLTPAFARALTEFETATPDRCFHSFNHLGGAVAQYKPNDTAFPWRSSNFEIFSTCLYKNDSERKIHSKYLHDLYYLFEQKGFCVGNNANDPDLELHDWQHKYYGSNYDRLLEIQEKWNPLQVGTYHYNLSIGSDYNPPPADRDRHSEL